MFDRINHMYGRYPECRDSQMEDDAREVEMMGADGSMDTGAAAHQTVLIGNSLIDGQPVEWDVVKHPVIIASVPNGDMRDAIIDRVIAANPGIDPDIVDIGQSKDKAVVHGDFITARFTMDEVAGEAANGDDGDEYDGDSRVRVVFMNLDIPVMEVLDESIGMVDNELPSELWGKVLDDLKVIVERGRVEGEPVYGVFVLTSTFSPRVIPEWLMDKADIRMVAGPQSKFTKVLALSTVDSIASIVDEYDDDLDGRNWVQAMPVDVQWVVDGHWENPFQIDDGIRGPEDAAGNGMRILLAAGAVLGVVLGAVGVYKLVTGAGKDVRRLGILGKGRGLADGIGGHCHRR